jgi:hypothetical protein
MTRPCFKKKRYLPNTHEALGSIPIPPEKKKKTTTKKKKTKKD